MKYDSISALQSDLHNGKVSCAALVDSYLKTIEDGRDMNIFLEVFTDEAKEQAKAVDQKIANGTAGKLAGLVVAIKDNMCYRGHVVSAASKILNGFESLFSATAVERLLAEDAIIIGRTNCDEFAMGSSNENSAYGKVHNPLNKSLSPGGSSGGSAAAVAANMCQVALGSDTGGSIRQPASFTGTVGIKPTYGRVSRHGLIAYASSFDQIGPFSRSMEDAARVMEVISGADEFDSTCASKEVPNNMLPAFEGKKKFVYYNTCLDHPSVDAEIKQHLISKIESLKAQGHEVEGVDFSYLDYLVPIYYVLTTAEASSNLARYDGIHMGYRSENANDLESTYKLSRSEGFGEEVQRRIMLGTFVLSSGFYDAYYGKAQKARNIVRTKTMELLEQYDFILMPTSPHTAFPLDQELSDPTVMYLEDIFTVQANITGLPAISIPTGTHSNGMPFGIQIMSAPFADDKLFACGEYILNL